MITYVVQNIIHVKSKLQYDFPFDKQRSKVQFMIRLISFYVMKTLLNEFQHERQNRKDFCILDKKYQMFVLAFLKAFKRYTFCLLICKHLLSTNN